MHLNIGELKNISNQCKENKISFLSFLKKVHDELNNITNNIKSDSLVTSNNDFKASLIDQAEILLKNLKEINEFMDKQIQDYDVTMEEAVNRVNRLIKSIDLCIDENGNVNANMNFMKADLITKFANVLPSENPEENVQYLLDSYNNQLVTAGGYNSFGDFLYHELDLASCGYNNGAEFISDVITSGLGDTERGRDRSIAAVMLYTGIASENGVKVNYTWGGGHNGGSALITEKDLSAGLDCSGFVSWGVQQGAVDGFETQTTSGLINSGYDIDVFSSQGGDIAVSTWIDSAGEPQGHTFFILENNPETQTLVVAEAYDRSNGIIVHERSYDEVDREGYVFKDMGEYYGEDLNSIAK